MISQEASDHIFETLLQEVTEIQYLIVKSGKMATKTAVENILIKRHGLDRADAHTLTNTTESRNKMDFSISNGKIVWTANRSEPTQDKYPEL